MKAMHVGQCGSHRFSLPVDFVTQTAAILARMAEGRPVW